MNSFHKKFLAQSYADTWDNYLYVRDNPSVHTWDYVIITASDQHQADSYEMQIKHRLENGFLPTNTIYLCLPDPEGKRVGSGGATLAVIKNLIEREGMENLSKKRILLIHSGGDSKRIPQYSACGKLFSPVPRLLPDGSTSTLFDEFYVQLLSMPERVGGGMLVLSGDVLLLFNPLQVSLDSKGATAVSIKAPAETGSHHGVFLTDSDGYVTEFLHKQTVSALHEKGAVNSQGNIDIDTGIVWMDGTLVSQFASIVQTDALFQQFVNERARLSFYGDFLYPLSRHATEERFLSQGAEHEVNDSLLTCRRKLWTILKNNQLAITKLSPAQFLHFGTTEELRDLTTSQVDDYQSFGWSRHILSVGESPGKDYATHTSFINHEAKVGEQSYIEDSYLESGTVVGRCCVVSSVNGEGVAFSIPDNTVVHSLKLLGNKYCARFYSVQDNPKQGMWFGRSILDVLESFSVPVSSVFDSSDTSLWNARLFPVCERREESLRWMQKIIGWINSRNIDSVDRAAWLQAERMSLATSFHLADTETGLTWQEHLETQIRASLFCNAIDTGKSHEEASKYLIHARSLVSSLETVLDLLKSYSFSTQLRLYKSISLLIPEGNLLDGKTAVYYEDLCYKILSDEVNVRHISTHNKLTYKPANLGDSVSVELPVRVNWGGGWSDTPPYCLDFGGTVLNAAITIQGKRPVHAKASILADPVVRFVCKDSSLSKEFTSLQPLLTCNNPNDPFALHKAVFSACGIIRKDQRNLCEQLAEHGGGIELETQVSVPKGSGLGASSILAGACVKAITKLLGADLANEELSSLTLCVEQLMSTGGGWQDQVGGLVPGIKVIQTKPGVDQTFSIRHLQLSHEALRELRERFVLVYTGQRRLARNILREVVGKVLTRDHDTMKVMQEIQKLAILMAYELERGNVTEFAYLLNKHWELSVKLDRGTTNTCIEYIFSCCEDLIDGKFVAGAGGGGFLMMVLKQGRTKEELNYRLESMFQDSGVAIWDCDFAMEG
jgi:fucokinase